MEFNENPKRSVINIDMDDTLTNGEPFWACDPQPNTDNIDIVRKLYKNGHIIIVHTARLWEYAPETVAWLIKHRVPYHGIYMAKGGADYYVDNKNVHIFQLLPMTQPTHEGKQSEGSNEEIVESAKEEAARIAQMIKSGVIGDEPVIDPYEHGGRKIMSSRIQ